MQTSSIFHFFARLMERRGYFVQENKLEDFAFPESIIAAKSTSGFPDFVLKTNQGNLLTGGELIELKDAKSYQISSFNSTMPSATKSISTLPKHIQNQLTDAGEDLKQFPERNVYYLIRGIKKTTSYPLAKTILVSGAFFETMPISDVLTNAFHQVTTDSTPNHLDHTELTRHFEVQQSHFAASRKIEGASISVRFRVMAEVDPRANLLNEKQYPMIKANTLTILFHDPALKYPSLYGKMHNWNSAPMAVKKCKGYNYLEQAYDEIDASMKSVTSVSILCHPMNGPFFMAQASIHP